MNRILKTFTIFVLSLCIVLSVPVYSQAGTFSVSSVTIEEGETVTVTYNFVAATLLVEDNTIATLSSKISTTGGSPKKIITITGVKSGTTRLKATPVRAGGGDDYLSITVIPSNALTDISISGSSNVSVGNTITLNPNLTPSNAEVNLVWSSSDINVASVSSSGVVTGKSVGSTTITVKDKDTGKQASKSITVNQLVQSISLNQNSLSLNIGDTANLSAIVSPSSASNKGVSWNSSNTGVATVSSSGSVKAVGAGSCTITCKASDDSGKQASCSIQVNSPSTATTKKPTTTKKNTVTQKETTTKVTTTAPEITTPEIVTEITEPVTEIVEATAPETSAKPSGETVKYSIKNIKVDYEKDGPIKIKWNKITDASGYELYCKNPEGEFVMIYNGSSPIYTINNYKYNQTYTFKVRAYNYVSENNITYYIFSKEETLEVGGRSLKTWFQDIFS